MVRLVMGFFFAVFGLHAPSLAEIKAIEAEATYVMGDNQSLADARELALIEAKRLASEEAGTYLEATTVVQEARVTKDDIFLMTAALMSTKVLDEKKILEGEAFKYWIKIRADIDTDVLTKRVSQLLQDQSMKEQVGDQARRIQELEALLKQANDLVAASDSQALPASLDNAKAVRQELDGQRQELREFQVEPNAYLAHRRAESQLNDRDGSNIRLAKLSVSLRPKDPQAYLRLAKAFLKHGKKAQARQALLRGQRALPGNKDIRAMLRTLGR